MPDIDVAAFRHVITKQGMRYLAKQKKGDIPNPKLTKAVAGSGFVDWSSMEEQTEVSEFVALMEMDEQELLDGSVVKLPLRLMNTGLTTSQLVQQVGLYADDPDEGEILIQLLQYETPQLIPSLAANRGAIWVFNCDLDVFFANAEAAVIPASPGWFIGRQEFNAAVALITPVISDTEPVEPCKIWLKPMGGKSIAGAIGGGDPAETLQPINVNGVHVGETPPDDKNMLWVKPST